MNFRTTVLRSSPPLSRPLAQVQSEARPTPSTDLPTGRLHATLSLGPSCGRGQGVRPYVDTRRPRLQPPPCRALRPMFVTPAVAKMGTLRRGQVGGELITPAPTSTSMPPQRPSPMRRGWTWHAIAGASSHPPTRHRNPLYQAIVLGGTALVPRGRAYIHNPIPRSEITPTPC